MFFLENLWTLHNLDAFKQQGVCFDKVKKLIVAAGDFGEDFVHLLVNECDVGPP
jgi:hypothetical protein